MKNLALLLTFFLFLFANASAQEWAPIGAEWYYEMIDASFTGPAIYGYDHLLSTKDTVIAGDTARLITRTTFMSDQRIIHHDPIIIRQDGQKVYHYFEGAFHLLYDFTARAGDTLHLKQTFYPTGPTGVDSFKIMIDSVTNETINGTQFKVQYGWGTLGMDYEVIERIGDGRYFLPFSDLGCAGQICPNGLRCYMQGSFTYKPTEIKKCDSFRTDPSGIAEAAQKEVSFTINNGRIYLSPGTPGMYEYQIFNAVGKLLQQNKIQLDSEMPSSIPLQLEKPGIYLIALSRGQNQLITCKFLCSRW